MGHIDLSPVLRSRNDPKTPLDRGHHRRLRPDPGVRCASARHRRAHKVSEPVHIATGLNNPRHLSVGPGNRIYVAESGTGGEGPCAVGAEGEVCLGMTGSITEINGQKVTRVVTGLPSLADAEGGGASGPVDVDVSGNNVAILIGLGGNVDYRNGFGPGGTTLGTLQTGRLGGTLSPAADLVAYEEAKDPDKPTVLPPDGWPTDSNPGGLLAVDSHNWVVADAGGNDLVGVGKRGERTIAVFPNDRTATTPWGAPMPFQSVPTDVVQGSGGDYYVSELTGFPFPEGSSTIWKVTRDGKRSVYATGLTHVTGLDFKGNTLYAVQHSDVSLLKVPEGHSAMGSVRRVVPGATEHPVVAENLTAPYGIAIRGNTAYATTGSTLASEGAVVSINLR